MSSIHSPFLTDLDYLISVLQNVPVDDDANDVFASKNQLVRNIYVGLKKPLTSLPLDRQHAETVRQSLIKQQHKSIIPQPWFDRQFFQLVMDREAASPTVEQSARASFVFEMLFPIQQNRETDGIPQFNHTESVLQELADMTYTDTVNLWQKGQVYRKIRETEITGISSDAGVNRLMDMDDMRLSVMLSQTIDDALKDIQRRNADIQTRDNHVKEAFNRIEELWAQRPTLQFVQEKQPLYKRLDRYLFQSNIENFLRKFTGLETPEALPPLPENPPIMSKSLDPPMDDQLTQSASTTTSESGMEDVKVARERILPQSLNILPRPIDEISRAFPLRFQNMTQSPSRTQEQTPTSLKDSQAPTIFSSDPLGENANPYLIALGPTKPVGMKRNIRRITFSSPMELRQQLNNFHDLKLEWHPDNVDILFTSEEEAQQFTERFSGNTMVQSVPNSKFQDFKGHLKDSPLPPTDAVSMKAAPHQIIVSCIDTSKLGAIIQVGSVSSERAIFNVANAIAGLVGIPIDTFQYHSLERKFLLGFKQRQAALAFGYSSGTSDVNDVWRDCFGEDVKVQSSPIEMSKAKQLSNMDTSNSPRSILRSSSSSNARQTSNMNTLPQSILRPSSSSKSTVKANDRHVSFQRPKTENSYPI